MQSHPSLFVCALLSIALMACVDQKDPDETASKDLELAWDKNADPILEADRLRLAQAYAPALDAYHHALTVVCKTARDSLYCMNQMAYCYLLQDQDQQALPWINRSASIFSLEQGTFKEDRPLFYYNKARLYFLQFRQDSALAYIRLSNSFGSPKETDVEALLHQLRCLSLMALIHYDKDFRSDSTSYYALAGNELVYTFPMLTPYSAETDFALACASLMFRAHDRGQLYCLNALEKLENTPNPSLLLQARCLSMWGNMLKKQGDAATNMKDRNRLYAKADTACFSKAIRLATQIRSIRIQEFWRDRIILVSRYEDSTAYQDSRLFSRYISELQQLLQVNEDKYGHIDRLKGYYFLRRNRDSSIYYYERFLTSHEASEQVEFHLLDESYFVLRDLHSQEAKFQQALSFSDKRAELFNCKSCPDGINPISISPNASTACINHYYFRSRVLFQQYLHQGEVDLARLIQLNQYFEEITRFFFGSIQTADEDAILTYQSEIGTSIFQLAIEVALRSWRQTKQSSWLDLAFRYMEQMKSYLLFRNMLRPLAPLQQELALSDSIRIYQGKVSELSHLLNVDPDATELEIWAEMQALLTSFVNAYSSQLTYASTRLSDVQQALSPDQVLIEYTKGPNQWYALCISNDSIRLFPIDSSLKDSIALYKTCFDTDVYPKRTKRAYVRLAQQLYSMLLEPAEDLLKSRRELIIIPDEILNGVPFETFLTRKIQAVPSYDYRRLPYLVKEIETIYSPSWKIYRRHPTPSFFKEDILTIGVWISPEFQEHTSMVADSIRLLGRNRAEVSIHFEEGKQAFHRSHQRYDLIHITQHASGSQSDRFDHHIYFGPNREDQLSSIELAQYSFKTRLLILSACQTNVGVYQAGEGTFSLTRSFLQSGVPQIVSAFWNVRQRPTDKIMASFYHHLHLGASPSSALRAAKQDFLLQFEGLDGAYPGNWAGMVLTK
ncbi:MAG: CHAT domain-containing tetratricopeptide repeat protein [Bacteroidota bacterium]